MPRRDHASAKVTVTVELDGHTLTFEESRDVAGPRLHGKPNRWADSTSQSFEHIARRQVADAAGAAVRRSVEMIERMYPIASADRVPVDG